MQSRAQWLTLFGLVTIPIAIMALSGAGVLRLRQVKALFAPDKSLQATLRLSGVKQSGKDYIPEDNLNAILGRYRNESAEMEVAYTLALMERTDEGRDGVRALATVVKKRGYTKEFCAHILRHAVSLTLLGGRSEVYRLYGATPPSILKHPMNELPMEVYDAILQGEKLDPDNAFFPLMRAILTFATPLENEPAANEQALSAIRTAAQKSRYEDYTWNEAELVNKIYTCAYGERSAYQNAFLESMIAVPQFLQSCNLGRILTCKAIDSAEKGDYKQSIAYRRDMFRIGGLLQNSSTDLANDTGNTMIETALQPRLRKSTTEKYSVSENRAETVAFLKQHGELGLAQWVVDNAPIAKSRYYDDKIMSLRMGVKESDYLVEFRWWLTDSLLWRTTFNLLLLTCLALYFLRNSAEKAGVAVASVIVLLVVTALWRTQTRFLADMREVAFSNYVPEAGALSPLLGWEGVQFEAAMWGIGWALPILLALLCGGYSLIRKRLFSQSLATAALVSVAALLWIIAFSPTPRIEASMKREMARYTVHEGRFLSEKAGRRWMNTPPVPYKIGYSEDERETPLTRKERGAGRR